MIESLESALRAYNIDPSCGAALYGLAQHFRQRGMHDVALVFAERGLNLPYQPGDSVDEDARRRWGFKAEIATSGWHSRRPEMRELGHDLSEEMALSRELPRCAQDVAWRNLFCYTKRLQDYAPSFSATKIDAVFPDGFYPMNPSICRFHDGMIMNVRCVNYRIDPRPGVQKRKPCQTRNFLFLVDDDLGYRGVGELDNPLPIAFDEVSGLEDMRLWDKDGVLCFSATSRGHNSEGWCEIVTGIIGDRYVRSCAPIDPKIEPRQHQKNWMPIVGWHPWLIYSCDPTRITCQGARQAADFGPAPVAAHHWKGSSQAIRFDGGWLAMVHERPSDLDPELGKPPYRQRFVWFDRNIHIRKISWGFEFGHGSAGEYVCGMCEHPDGQRLVISYGVLDREAWLATVDADEVHALLREA